MCPTAQRIDNRAKPIPKTFLGLQKTILVLRPIHSKANYNKALKIASDLASRTNLTREQTDYLEVLVANIKAYEDDRFKTKKHSPVEMLKFLVEENGLDGSKLGRILGHRTLGSKLLSGERKLSKAHIKKLTEHFSVEPNLFL